MAQMLSGTLVHGTSSSRATVRACCGRLEDEVARLESHLDNMRSVYALNADKLEYNYRVLGEYQGRGGEEIGGPF